MNTKPSVYIETTIPSFLTARDASDAFAAGEQEATRRWWHTRRYDYQLYISQLVLDEAVRGDSDASRKRIAVLDGISILASDDSVKQLTAAIVSSKILPLKAAADAAHVALAARYAVDFLLTLNCKHIANAHLTRQLTEIVSNAGYRMPVVCTPYQLMGDLYHET